MARAASACPSEHKKRGAMRGVDEIATGQYVRITSKRSLFCGKVGFVYRKFCSGRIGVQFSCGAKVCYGMQGFVKVDAGELPVEEGQRFFPSIQQARGFFLGELTRTQIEQTPVARTGGGQPLDMETESTTESANPSNVPSSSPALSGSGDADVSNGLVLRQLSDLTVMLDSMRREFAEMSIAVESITQEMVTMRQNQTGMAQSGQIVADEVLELQSRLTDIERQAGMVQHIEQHNIHVVEEE